MTLFRTHLLLTAASFLFFQCGSKDTESTAAATCATTAPNKTGGYVLCVGTSTSTTIELTGGSGEQYVVAAYTLGDHASVVGAGSQALAFSVKATSASLQGLKSNPELKQTELTESNHENLLRLVANRFDAKRGEHQEPWIWDALKTLDSGMHKNMLNSQSYTSHFKGLAKQDHQEIAPPTQSALTLANCPTTAPTADASSTVSLASSFDGTSFCIGYSADPTGDTKENVQASVKAVLAAYKDTIYQDQMTTNVKDGYAFNPLIVFVSSLAYDGAFSKTATTSAKRPVLHIKSTISKAKLHATIAHEMQHAIVDYYKYRGSVSIEETVGVDEGVAHMMEDAFGYGEDNFASYVKNFLSGFVDGSAVLANNDNANAAAARGGANALMYFMAIRAGGFSVTGGKPFSGDGMKAIVAMVKQTDKTGPAGVAAAFGQPNLTERVGQLIGALFNDNRSLSYAPTEFASTTYTGITDILGTTNLTFGIRFNNFKSFTTTATNALKDGASISSKHYESLPILVTPTAATSTVTVTLPGVANSGITVARIK